MIFSEAFANHISTLITLGVLIFATGFLFGISCVWKEDSKRKPHQEIIKERKEELMKRL